VTGTLHKEHLDKKFKQRWEAERFINDLQKQEDAARSKQNNINTTLTQEQVNDATAAFDKIPKDVSLSQIVDFYIHHKPQEEKSVQDAYEHYLAEKERVGLSNNTTREIKSIMKPLVKGYSYKLTSSIQEANLAKFIQKGKVAPQTQNNRQKVYHKFFNYCLKQDWISENPLRRYEKIKIVHDTVQVFTPMEARTVIETVAHKDHEALLPYITLMMFSGLRSCEASKLSWDKIRFDQNTVGINIDTKIAKTSSRRHITVQKNAAKLLNYCNDNNLTVPYPKNFRKRFDKLKAATGIEWSSNILRHTFGTYRYALKGTVSCQIIEIREDEIYLKIDKDVDDELFMRLGPTKVSDYDPSHLDMEVAYYRTEEYALKPRTSNTDNASSWGIYTR
jgi:integrase